MSLMLLDGAEGVVPYGKAVVFHNSSCARNIKVSVCSDGGGGGESEIHLEPFGGKKQQAWSQNVA